MKMKTPCKAFIKSVIIHSELYAPNQTPCAHERTSANQVTPITITSLMQILPSVVLHQIDGNKNHMFFFLLKDCTYAGWMMWQTCYRSVVDLTSSRFHSPQVN